MINFEDFYKRFFLDDYLVRTTGHNPYYSVLQSGIDESMTIDGENFIDLASNNYLGIANNQRIKNASIKAIEKYGVSLCATPIASGYTDLYEEVSNEFSAFAGLESSIIYPSCYQANNGLFSVIAKKDDVIIIDQYAHSSLIEGARACGCKIRPFLHNNLDSLEKNLVNSQKYEQIYVVTESVFSTEGSIAPFKSIVELSYKYNAVPIIDDSHGIGVIGKNGRGILEHSGILVYKGIYTASLGKSMGNLGGIISGEKKIIDYLRYYSTHLVYSTAIPPSILAGISEAIKIINEDFHGLSERLWNHYKTLREALQECGYHLSSSEAPIISVITGTAENTFLFAKELYKRNILATPFVFPSVPKNKGVIRLIAGANFKEATILDVISVFKDLSKKYSA